MNEKTTTGMWPALRERIERTVEGIELIKKAWSSTDYFEHNGKHYKSFFYLYTKPDRKSTRLNSSHLGISYAVFCLKKKKKQKNEVRQKVVNKGYACEPLRRWSV